MSSSDIDTALAYFADFENVSIQDLNDAIGSMDRVIEQIEELLNHIGIPRTDRAAGSGDIS